MTTMTVAEAVASLEDCRNGTSAVDVDRGLDGTDVPLLAKRVSSSRLDECGARLRQGELVAFPTETVYGLGCHALNPRAIAKVFQAKERPLTDPLIVHVLQAQDAYNVWHDFEQDNHENKESSRITTSFRRRQEVLQVLCDSFWPGPLTLVAKARSTVPSILMADTGFVACRCPSYPLARALLQHARVPLAAPSANKFGHVSPTHADHVWDDLRHENVWILEEDEANDSRFGVESTVAKLDGHTLTVLRQGAISVSELQACLHKAGLGQHVTVTAAIKRATPDHVANVAPGQTVRHYSPHIPSFMISEKLRLQQEQIDRESLERSVLVDYGQRLVHWKSHVLEYRDLSAAGRSAEAAQVVFETLRWAEQVPGATRILFPSLVSSSDDKHDDALLLAVQDRLTRAASGVVLESLSQ